MDSEVYDDRRVVPRRFFLGAGAATAALLTVGGNQPADAANVTTALDVVATPAAFPGLDPSGAADSSTALQNALNVVPDGATLIIPAGTYVVSKNLLVIKGRSIAVVGYGATLIQQSAQSVFSVGADYDSPFVVSKISVVSRTFASGATAPVAIITLASSPGWVAGNVVKIVSDDVIPEGRPISGSNQKRLGEFAVVHSVNGKTVVLTGLLRENYVTNIRAARINQQTFRLEGVNFITADARIGQVNQPLVVMRGLLNPVVRNVRASRSGGTVLHFASCMGFHAEAINVSYAKDSPSDTTLGYGINDAASSFGRVIGGTFSHVRHAYTTGTDNVAANSDVRGYGRTYGGKVIGTHAYMTTSTSFDCHHEGEAIEFIGCTATGGIPDGSGNSGFGLRGLNHRVTSCTVRDKDAGVSIYTDTAGGESRGHVITDLVAHDMTTTALSVSVHQSGHPSANQRDTVENARVSGLIARGCQKGVMATNAIVTLSDLDYQAPAGSDGVNYDGVLGKNSKVTLRGGLMDYEGNTAGVPRPLVTTPSTGTTPGVQETYVDSLEVRANANVVGRAWSAFGGSDHIVHARNILFTYPFRLMPGTTRDESTYEWSCRVTPGVDASQTSSWYTLLQADTTEKPITEMLKSVSPRIHINIWTASKARTAAALPAGNLRGQQLTFYLDGSGSFTLRNGAAYKTILRSGADKVLTDGMSVWLFWDGTNWRER